MNTYFKPRSKPLDGPLIEGAERISMDHLTENLSGGSSPSSALAGYNVHKPFSVINLALHTPQLPVTPTLPPLRVKITTTRPPSQTSNLLATSHCHVRHVLSAHLEG